MRKFPVDAALEDVIRTFTWLGFRLLREGNHFSMLRDNADGTHTSLTMPNHRRIKGSTLRTILTQAGISRDDFLNTFDKSR